MPAYCDQADVEYTVGGPNGAATLRQLLGTATGAAADSTLVDKCINEAYGELNTALQVKVDLSSLSEPYDPILVRLNSALAGELAHLYGAGGQAMPPLLEKHLSWAREWLQLFAEGKRSLGHTDTAPTLNQVAELVDHDEEATGISRAGLAGFR